MRVSPTYWGHACTLPQRTETRPYKTRAENAPKDRSEDCGVAKTTFCFNQVTQKRGIHALCMHCGYLHRWCDQITDLLCWFTEEGRSCTVRIVLDYVVQSPPVCGRDREVPSSSTGEMKDGVTRAA